jgi:signal transduction histidine kinase
MPHNRPLGRLHILLVEDNDHDRLAFRRAFRHSEPPADITEYVQAEDALERIISDHAAFDVVVTDHNLPGMSGLELCREILQRKVSLPLIILTGGGSEHLAVEALKAGVNDYLIKDVEGGYLALLPLVLPEAIQQHHNFLARKQAEEALAAERALLAQRVKERTAELSKANAELARALRLKDEFLATISHELRTPLHVILGISESLEEGVYDALTPKQLGAFYHIKENAQRLSDIITDMLDLSEISVGKLALNVTKVSVEAVCQYCLQAVRHVTQQKGVQLSFRLDSAVNTVYADKKRLQQVLMNFISNAIKFTPPGGKIGLEIAGDAENETAYFSVWDTGIGIAREDVQRLFQPFTQIDARLSRKYEGLGLGLSLAYHLVEMHGGSISVESEVGQGSRFSVSVPWQPNAPQAAPAVQLPQAWLVLIVGDRENTLTMLEQTVKAQGGRAALARNGREALERIREERPALVLMDIHMPEVDGLEAIRCIRTDAESAALPIVALTTLYRPGDRVRFLAAGANEYLRKPVGAKVMARLLETWLGHKEA